DGNGRLITSDNLDGTQTNVVYDPMTGAVGAVYVNMSGNNSDPYQPGIDPKTVYHYVSLVGSTMGDISTAVTNPSIPTGIEIDQLSSSGVQTTDSMQSAGGLSDLEIANGLKTQTTAAPSGSPGGWTDTANNPDGTKTIDTYTGDVLTDEHSVGTNGVSFDDQSFGYDPLARVTQSTSRTTGTSNWTLFNDGSLSSLTLPGHGATAVDQINPTTDDPTQVTRADDRA